MTGQAHWLTLLLFLGFAGAIAAYVLGTGRLLGRFRPVQRGFLCPRTGDMAQGTMVRDSHTGQWTGVIQCNARVPGQPCTLGCVTAENAAAARKRLERRAASQP